MTSSGGSYFQCRGETSDVKPLQADHIAQKVTKQADETPERMAYIPVAE